MSQTEISSCQASNPTRCDGPLVLHEYSLIPKRGPRKKRPQGNGDSKKMEIDRSMFGWIVHVFGNLNLCQKPCLKLQSNSTQWNEAQQCALNQYVAVTMKSTVEESKQQWSVPSICAMPSKVLEDAWAWTRSINTWIPRPQSIATRQLLTLKKYVLVMHGMSWYKELQVTHIYITIHVFHILCFFEKCNSYSFHHSLTHRLIALKARSSCSCNWFVHQVAMGRVHQVLQLFGRAGARGWGKEGGHLRAVLPQFFPKSSRDHPKMDPKIDPFLDDFMDVTGLSSKNWSKFLDVTGPFTHFGEKSFGHQFRPSRWSLWFCRATWYPKQP